MIKTYFSIIDTISSIKDTFFPIKGVDKIHKYLMRDWN